MLTDTHTHLYSEAFAEDRNQMMQRAFDAGIDRFFIPAIDSGYTEAMYALEKEYPENVFLNTTLEFSVVIFAISSSETL